MKLYLYRRYKKPTYTIGHLYDGVQRLCSTLEDRVRTLIDINGDGDFNDAGEGKGRVYGHTAIPAGSYAIEMQMSPTFKRMMPYLQDVPGFSYVMIHPGNYAGYRKLFMTTTIYIPKKYLPLGELKVV